MPFYMIKRSDNGVIIMQTAADDIAPEDCVAKWAPDQQALVVSIHPIELADIPTDRYFRNAWKPKGDDAVEVDMPRARDIHRDVLRRMRAPLFESADVDYVKADEAGDEPAKQAVREYKQELRDVPQDPRIDAAQTPEELKAVIPDVLKT